MTRLRVIQADGQPKLRVRMSGALGDRGTCTSGQDGGVTGTRFILLS